MTLERNLGEQPLAGLMDAAGLQPRDLVAASGEQLTFKMIARARKGRRLTLHMQAKIARALTRAAGRPYTTGELFNYAGE